MKLSVWFVIASALTLCQEARSGTFSLDKLNALPQVGELSDGTVVDYYTENVKPRTGFSAEKHVPHLQLLPGDGLTVEMSIAHVMLPEHFIQNAWVVDQAGNLIFADSFETPSKQADPPLAVQFQIPSTTEYLIPYSYCNLHGRWQGARLSIPTVPDKEL